VTGETGLAPAKAPGAWLAQADASAQSGAAAFGQAASSPVAQRIQMSDRVRQVFTHIRPVRVLFESAAHHAVTQQSAQGQVFPPVFRRKLTVEFNPNKAVTADAAAGITWLDLERIEERYLLAACADGGQCMSTWKKSRREFRDLQP
jgi:hypothetical protein